MTNRSLAELRELADRRSDAKVIPHVIKLLAMGGGSYHHALGVAETIDAPLKVTTILKAAVAGGTTGSVPALSGTGNVLTSWAETLAAQSAFMRMYIDGAFIETPYRKRFGAASAPLIGSVIDEGRPVPLSSLQLASEILEPIKVGAMVVCSDDVWRDASPAGLALVTKLLADAVAKAVDEAFFLLTNDLTPVIFNADGNDLVAVRMALRLALDTVHSRAGGRLYWAASPTAANALASFSELATGGVTPMGGTLLGIPVVVTDGLPGMTVSLVDASGIAAKMDGIEFERSNAGAVQFLDNPTNNSDDPTATSLVSLFQTNNTAMRAVLRFASDRIRDGVVASIDLEAS